ncbi:hypothetical protein HY345_04080 [Candidatus Microgenomates bacterium]|nr:hypothetical protein [Candidatus Microgenomates bacterium]
MSYKIPTNALPKPGFVKETRRVSLRESVRTLGENVVRGLRVIVEKRKPLNAGTEHLLRTTVGQREREPRL